MIRRYFYIFSSTLFILLSANKGIKAEVLDKRPEETMELQTNSPPAGINYQAVIRGDDGVVEDLTPVTIRFTVTDGDLTHWVESHEVVTDAFGNVSLVIGQGTPEGGIVDEFGSIDWSQSLSVQVELNTGAGFVDAGTQPLNSVPYANFAANGLSPDQAAKLTTLPANAEENIQPDWNQLDDTADSYIQNKPVVPADINELADSDGLLAGASFDGSFSSLTDVPEHLDIDSLDDFSGSYVDLTEKPSIPTDINELEDADEKLFSGSYRDLDDLPSNLDNTNANFFSGSYNELRNRPTIPGAIDDLSDDQGNVNLAGTFTADSLVIDGAFAFPKTDGTVGQVLTTDGDGKAAWGTASSGAFGTSSNVISAGDADDDFVFGSTQLANNTGTDDDHRIFFDKSKGAFRAGRTAGAEWDDENIGTFSVALGSYGFATGSHSIVGGGNNNTASGNFSATFAGYSNKSTGLFSAILGGASNTASGSRAIILGGRSNTASGDYSTLLSGRYSNAHAAFETVIGPFSEDATSPNATSFISTDRLVTIGNGTSTSARSNAMVILKNGNTDINGTFTANSLGVDGAFTLPTADGTNGQVLTTNGSGVASWGTASSGAFANSSNLVSAGDADDDFVFGSTQLADAGGTDDNNRVFFDKSKAAFRAGNANNSQWDDSNVGDNTAVVGGLNNTASGGTAGIVGGSTNTASGYGAFIGGGLNNSATTARTFIGGGINNTASGSYSATVGGRGLEISASNATAIGKYNNTTSGTGVLFVIGNGTSSSAKSDALVVKDDGSADLNGAFKANSLGVDGAFTLPTADGTNGQVLKTNGSGTVFWGSSYGGTGTNSFNAGTSNNALGANSTIGGGTSNAAGIEELIDAGLTANFTTVGGGKENVAVRDYATVAGGFNNDAFGKGSTIAGGQNNRAGTANSTGSEDFSTIGGGDSNSARAKFATIPGGTGLSTTSYGATVIGIHNNTTGGTSNSFVATDAILVVGNGTSSSAKSDAMVMLKNGNTDINGTFTANSLGVDGAFTLPTADGTIGQVLSTNGSGAVAWSSASSGAFGNSSNLVSAGDADDDFVFGSTQLADDNSGTTDNRRVFFDKSKGAFRAGYASGTQWDDANVGNNSAAIGGNGTIASGIGSVVAGGYTNVASGPASFVAGGGGNTASQDRSVVVGGYGNIASGARASIFGGQSSTASATNSTVIGGKSNAASGQRSLAAGSGVNAQAYSEFAIGTYSLNATSPNANSIVATDRLVTIGNGTSDGARSNALIILKNGNATLAGTLTQSSDRRLKRDIKPLGNTLDKVNAMEAVTYKWNDLTPRDTVELNIGLIAQEVEKLFPDLVKEADNGFKSVNYVNLVPVLIEAIKELSAQNEKLTQENDVLEAKQTIDDQRFSTLEAQVNLLTKTLLQHSQNNNVTGKSSQ